MVIKMIYATMILIFAIIGMTMLLDINPLRLRKGKKRLYFVSMMLIVLISIVLMLQTGQLFRVLYPLLIHLPLMVLFCYITDRGFAKVLFALLTMVFMSYPPALLDLIIVKYFIVSGPVQLIVLAFSCALTLLFIFKFMAKDFSYVMNELQTGDVIRFCFVPIGYNILNYLLGRYEYSSAISPIRIVLFLSAVGVYSLLLRFFRRTRDLENIKREQTLLNWQMDSTIKQLNDLSQSQQQTLIYRHDLRHHMRYLNTCIAENKLQEAEEYIKQICSDVDAVSLKRYSENDAINLILSYYAGKAKENEMDIELAVSANDFSRFQINDLCSLLSNALDNAVKAGSQAEEPSLRYARLRLFEKSNRLCMELCNGYATEPVFEYKIPVSQKDGHGFGVKSMIHVVEKYEGVYGFTAKDGEFCFQMSM